MAARGADRKTAERGPSKVKKDAEAGKANPQSISNTLEAIGKYLRFRKSKKKTYRTQTVFSQMLKKKYDLIYKRYPRSKMPESGNVRDSKVKKFETNTKQLEYLDLRAYAEFAGYQTGALLIFTHVIGLVSKVEFSKQQVTSFLDHLIESLLTLRNLVADQASDNQMRNAFLNEIKTDPLNGQITQYSVKIEALTGAIDCFRGHLEHEDERDYEAFKLLLKNGL